MTKPRPFLSEFLPDAVSTEADTQSLGTNTVAGQTEAWRKLIDHQLIEWGRDPSQLADEGIEAPSRHTIRLSVAVANAFCEAGLAAPTRIVPDAHGSIVFERRTDEILESCRISADNRIEYCVFKDLRLAHRESWDLQGVFD